ncbi:hypothetical protein D3C76_1224620 [compost metagenome]
MQQAGQVQAQFIALQLHRVDLQPVDRPMRRQLQALELLAAVEQQAGDLNVPEFERQRQIQVRKRDRPTALLRRAGRKLQADLISLQLIDAQGHARQAQRRPGEDDFIELDPAGVLLPQHTVGAPLPAQAALEIVQAQTRHKPERPATACGRAQHRGQCQDHQYQQCQNGQQRYSQTTRHSSGPMEKCNRMPPSSSSA